MLNSRALSRLGPRGCAGLAIGEIAQADENVIVLSADLGVTSGLAGFMNSPRFINAGIAEQNLLGVAAGFAKEGYNVYCTTFATFASMRACEFVRLHMSYAKFNIKLIGLTAGYGMAFFGNTHYATEDIAVLRSMPNLTILSPADCLETVKCIKAATGPTYIRLTGVSGNPIVYKDDYEYTIGKAITHREGKDVAIIATGTMVYQSLEAAKLLEKEGIDCSVIDMHAIKPLDEEMVLSLMDKQLIVTVEEHSKIGGLGSAVAEVKSRVKNAPPQLFIGADDCFRKAGDYKYMLEQNGLTANQIFEKIFVRLTFIS